MVLTESLSISHGLTRSGLAVGWILFLISGLFRWWKRRTLPPADAANPSSWLGAAYAFVLCGIVTIGGFTALRSAPNSADAMAYHLPRILYWVQDRSVEFFPTSYFNQITLQPGAEYLMLQTYLLSGGDHFVNLVQVFSFAASLVAVSRLADELGLDGTGQAVAALVAGTLPNAILQASGAKNDPVLALWLVCALYFAARWTRTPSGSGLFFVAASVGLALLTKATAYLFLPPLMAGVLLAAGLRHSWRRWAALAGASPGGHRVDERSTVLAQLRIE